MKTYTLEIQIDPNDLEQLRFSGQQIAIVNKIGPTPVVWKALMLKAVHEVTWRDEYSLYASNTPLQPGVIIQPMTSIPAQPQFSYRFDGMSFTESGAPAGPGGYTVQNDTSASWTFGLYQEGAVSAEALHPQMQTPDLISTETIQIFTQADVRNGQVLSSVPNHALTLDFSSTPQQRVKFDASRGTFVLQ